MGSGPTFIANWRRIAARAGVVALLALVLLMTSVWPGRLALVALLGGSAAALVATAHRRRVPPTRLLAAGAIGIAGAGLTVALAVVVGLWPATTLLTVIVLGILVLAWRRPALGLGAAA